MRKKKINKTFSVWFDSRWQRNSGVSDYVNKHCKKWLPENTGEPSSTTKANMMKHIHRC